MSSKRSYCARATLHPALWSCVCLTVPGSSTTATACLTSLHCALYCLGSCTAELCAGRSALQHGAFESGWCSAQMCWKGAYNKYGVVPGQLYRGCQPQAACGVPGSSIGDRWKLLLCCFGVVQGAADQAACCTAWAAVPLSCGCEVLITA
jgi:hypothetical protein